MNFLQNDLIFLNIELFYFFILLFLFLYSILLKKYLVFNFFSVFRLNLIILFNIIFLFFNLIFLPNSFVFFNLFSFNFFFLFFKFLLIFFFILFLVFKKRYFILEGFFQIEYLILTNLIIFSLFLMFSANNLIAFFILLELQSLALYILAAFKYYSTFSTEAALKYFILGAISSVLIGLGISFIYGLTGSFNFQEIYLNFFFLNLEILDNQFFFFSLLGSLFIFIGFFFKLGIAPFHMWLPDVYEGVSTITTLFFSVFPKFTIFIVFFNFLFNVFGIFFNFWVYLFLFSALLSSIIGTFGGLTQIKIKRLLAYSSINHVGFLLIGLTLNSYLGLISSFIYLFIYVILSFSLFSIILVLRKTNFIKFKRIYDLKNLLFSNYVLAWCFILNLFSIAGIPPLLGFFAKLNIFYSLLNNNSFFIVFFFLILSMFSSFYYLRMIKLIFFDINSNKTNLIVPSRLEMYLIIFFTFINLFFIFFSDFIYLFFYKLIFFL